MSVSGEICYVVMYSCKRRGRKTYKEILIPWVENESRKED